MITLKKFYSMMVLGLMVFVLSGCGLFNKDDEEDVVYKTGEDVVNFAKEFTELTFKSSSFDELRVFIENRGSVLSDSAKVDSFDFNDVSVMNMFKDDGAVSNYEIVEVFVEDGLSNGDSNVVVVSQVTYSIANMEEDEEHESEFEEDFHSLDVLSYDKTVVDVFRIKEGLIVSVERL